MTEQSPTDNAPQAVDVSSPATKTCFADRPWLLASILVIATFLAYRPVWHAGFIWDDDFYVTHNTTLRSVDGLHRIWCDVATPNEAGVTPQYYPLTYTSFWLEYHLWQLKPLGYHIVNVALHALNAILVLLVLRKLGLRGAWLAAAIFAVHPVHVESVAWVTERKNVLSVFFYLSALLAYLHFLARGASGSDLGAATHSPVSGMGPKPWLYYWLAVALYGCALLSKSVTCSLPVIILLLVWWKRGRVRWRDVCVLLPFLALGLALGLITMKAENPQYTLLVIDRCLLAGRNLWFYAGKLAWPEDLTFVYPRWEIDANLWWQWLYPIGVVGALVGLWTMRERWGRGALVAVLCFVLTLLPAVGVFGIFYFHYSYVADHFQYLASIGLIALAASEGAGMCERLGQGNRSIGPIVAAVLLLTLGALTWQQSQMYQDAQLIWQDTLAKNPQCWMAHLHVGLHLLDIGEVPEAIHHDEMAVQIKPDSAMARYDLANALLQGGWVNEAIEQYRVALELEPDDIKSHTNLGNAFQQVGRLPEAMKEYREGLRLKPDVPVLHANLGAVLYRMGQTKDAIAEYREALRLQPDYDAAYANLGTILAQSGQREAAISEYEQALRFNPKNIGVHYNLGVALQAEGRVSDAIEQYEQALKLQPDLTPASERLAALRAAQH